MSRYDDLFEEVYEGASVFKEKSALNPLEAPTTLTPRPNQEKQIASLLQGINDDYLPSTVSIYGPPGTGKTVLTRRLSDEFASRRADLAVEYVNLKECKTVFSAANEILLAFSGTKVGSYIGLDGVFERLWESLAEYPDWTVLILDEIDHVTDDQNYDPNDFLYRLLRGEGKLDRDINLSVFLISNKLLTVDLRVDSRVESAMAGEEVFFPPYSEDELQEIIENRLSRAFQPGAITDAAVNRGVQAAANRWGDARKMLRLFRQAGELANERELDRVTLDCVNESLERTEREATVSKIRSLPRNHVIVLAAAAGRKGPEGNILQPIRVSQIESQLEQLGVDERYHLGQRAVQRTVTDLETMGLVDTWVESTGEPGRAKFLELTFEPQWALDALVDVLGESVKE